MSLYTAHFVCTDRTAQQQLSDACRKQAPVAFGLVTSCKASGPRVRDPQGKQALLQAAKGAAEAIKRLLAASKDLAAVSGAAEIETALEALAVEDAAIDSAALKADSGMLQVCFYFVLYLITCLHVCLA